MQTYTKNTADILSRLIDDDIPKSSHDIINNYDRFVAIEATPIGLTTRLSPWEQPRTLF